MAVEFENWSEFVNTALGPYGGTAVVAIALITFLANLYASFTLQRASSKFSKKLANIEHEHKLRESSYEKHFDLLLEYYSTFYRHYRLCQNATNQDAHRIEDGTIIKTKDIFFEQLDDYISQSKAHEGKTRLVLPAHLLDLHEESIAAFNEFKNVMKQPKYDADFQIAKRESFANIIIITDKLENGLRDLLRTEGLIVTK